MERTDPEFEEKVARAYQDSGHALGYSQKHERSWATRFKDRREQNLMRRALARTGKVQRILDCPSGTGRFWNLLSEFCDELLVADASAEMIEAGRVRHPGIDLADVAVGRAQDLPHEEASVDTIFCSRLLHHFLKREQRIEILSCLASITRKHVIFSAWVTGNLKHRRDLLNSLRRPGRSQTRFFVPRGELEAEAREAGLAPRSVFYKMRGVSPLVVLVCDKISE